jgi:hypothetical protein
MAPRRTPTRYLAVALTALSTAACGNDLNTANSGPGEEITRDARDEVEAALSALTLQSSLDPIGTQAAAGPTALTTPRIFNRELSSVPLANEAPGPIAPTNPLP